MTAPLSHASFVDSRRRHILLVGLFDAFDRAGVRPVAPPLLHAAWYLANALAPAWRLAPFDAAVLKTGRQPYFPMLQRDVDALTGMGMLTVLSLTIDPATSQLQGNFALNRDFADRVLAMMTRIPEEAELLDFLLEIVQALNRLATGDQQTGLSADASYADPRIDVGNVVDLGEWIERGGITRTGQVLLRIQGLADLNLLPAECMEIYMDHLDRGLNRG